VVAPVSFRPHLRDAVDAAAQDILIAACPRCPRPGGNRRPTPRRRQCRARLGWASSTRVWRHARTEVGRLWRVLLVAPVSGQARAGVIRASAVTVVSDGIRIHRIG
jgi:hypothetical protein